MATGQMHKVVAQLRRAVLGDGGAMTDEQLLESFLAQREQAAFEALVQRHGQMVLGVCRRVLNHSHDAEDAFQATFLVLVRKAASLLTRKTIGDWLYGVAYHTALKARAGVVKRRAKERKAAEMAHAKPLENVWPELQPVLDRELSRLPEKYRVPVVLCDLEGKTRKQAAQQLGWPEGTVSGRLSRARVLLAKRLTRHGITLSGGSLAVVLSQQAASACVPAALVVSTAKAAILVAAGQAVASALISAKVVALTEGVMKAMFITKLKIATAVVLTVSMVGTGAGMLSMQTPAAETFAAQQAGQREKDKDDQKKPDLRREGDQGPSLLPPGIERLDLSETQKEKLAQLHKESQEQLAPAKKTLGEAIEQAKQDQDREKAEKAMQTFRMEVTKIQEGLHGHLQKLLTEKQNQRLAELQRHPPGGGGFDLPRILGQLDLSAEQQEKIGKFMKEMGEKQEAAQKTLREAVEKAKENQDKDKLRELFDSHHKEMAKAGEELLQKVMPVLSDEQRKKFSELQQRHGPQPGLGIGQVLPPPIQERLGLTPEQREKIAALQKDMEAKLGEILTEDQKRTFEELKRGGPPDRPRKER